MVHPRRPTALSPSQAGAVAAPARIQVVPVRLRVGLFGLTLVAGWVDALSFLGLGKVFTSFMSGNVLFCGIALGQRDWSLLANALVALLAFVGGAVAGAELVWRHPPGTRRLSRPLLLAEAFVLLVFALAWMARGGPGEWPGGETGLLMLAAFGMGMQALAVIVLGIPGVATNALTGTVTFIAHSLHRRLRGEPEPAAVGSRYLLLLCLAYLVSAAMVALTARFRSIALVPFTLLLWVALLTGGSAR